MFYSSNRCYTQKSERSPVTMFERILRSFGNGPRAQLALLIEGELLTRLNELAVADQRPVDEVVRELLHQAVTERYAAARNFQPWEHLTPREKQAAALACLGYTNDEIAELMVISKNTVKTHMRHVLRKFDVRSKIELRDVLTGWDFSDWIESEISWPNGPSVAADRISSVGSSS